MSILSLIYSYVHKLITERELLYELGQIDLSKYTKEEQEIIKKIKNEAIEKQKNVMQRIKG